VPYLSHGRKSSKTRPIDAVSTAWQQTIEWPIATTLRAAGDAKGAAIPLLTVPVCAGQAFFRQSQPLCASGSSSRERLPPPHHHQSLSVPSMDRAAPSALLLMLLLAVSSSDGGP
jgi:hypothetical protein